MGRQSVMKIPASKIVVQKKKKMLLRKQITEGPALGKQFVCKYVPWFIKSVKHASATLCKHLEQILLGSVRSSLTFF